MGNKLGEFLKLYCRFLIPSLKKKLNLLFRVTLPNARKRILIYFTTKHIYGPSRIDSKSKKIVVACLVKNGELFIKSFIEYYFSLGAGHIVFLDNDSTDKTIEIARSYRCVSVLQSKLHPVFDTYEVPLREYLIKRFCMDRWCLLVDIDEFFDYPFSDNICIGALISYLEENHYTGVITQMLDLFSGKPLGSFKSSPDDNLKETYPYYDLSNITKYDFIPKITNRKIKVHCGGIRKTVFNTNNCLTKQSLIFVTRKLKLFDQHYVLNVHSADFSAVLYHYKFPSDFPEIAAKYAAENNVYYRYEYTNIVQACTQNPSLLIKQKTSKELVSVNDLLQEEFLVLSTKFSQWVERHADKR